MTNQPYIKQLKTDTISALNALNKENQAFVRNLMLSMYGDNIFKDETALGLKLNEIINDFAQAEQDGISAEDFFGQQPKKASQEILAAIPNKKVSDVIKDNLLLFCITVLFVAFLSSISIRNINGADHAYFSILSAVLTPTLISLLIYLIFKIFSFIAFTKDLLKIVALFCLTSLTFYFMVFLLGNPIHWLSFEVPMFWVDCQLIAVLLYLTSMLSITLLTVHKSRKSSL
ncbi:hypothetical protein RyT2_18120 [Pseudolactococcus yaeyamensis]